MADIFNRNASNLAGVFTADAAKLVLKGNLGVLVQQMQVNYAQTVTRLYEVGANGPNGASNTYYVGGRTNGQMSLNRVVGPSNSITAFYRQYGDVCKANANQINLTLTQTDCSKTGANATGATNYTISAAVITNVSVGVAAQDMLITDASQLMFSSLSTDDKAA